MDDLLLMDVVQSFTNLSDDRTYVLFLHSSGFSEPFEELAIRAKLYQKVDVLGVLEVAIERSDVPVLEVELNAELPGDLILIFLGLYLLLGHRLHAAEETCQLVLDDHHFTELPFAHSLANLEVVLTELF